MLGRTFSAAAVVVSVALAPCALAQWSPTTGQWGRTEPTDLRVMTWNVRDTICSSNVKQEDLNDWTACARIVAAMKPDVLILQECGDNVGNGTGAFADPVSFLADAMNMFINGGPDIYNPPAQVTSWVKKYDPALSYPYIYVSSDGDGFNRNVIASRYPFVDLNGDTRATYADFSIIPGGNLYAPGGDGGIRGWGVAEIDLPDTVYRGDLVIGCSHLKSGGAASDLAERLTASRNIAYYIDHFYGGAGGAVPDPNNAISDSPQATRVLDEWTPVIWGGDWNEDEQNNGRKGPAEWMTQAQNAGGTDGTDADRTDSTYDSATNPFGGSRATFGSTSKLDYIAWQDSKATLRRAFVFNSATVSPTSNLPPEVLSFGLGQLLSNQASDHRPVIADFVLALAPACPADLDGDGNVGSSDLASLLGGWGAPGPADFNGSGAVDSSDLASLLGAWGPCP